MINFHHLEKSRSQRVLWLLEELGEKYKLKVYPRDRKTFLALPAYQPAIANGGPVTKD